MRLNKTMVLLCCCGWLSGCSIVGTATHNVLTEIHQHQEDHAEHRRNADLATQAWAEYQAGHAATALSDAFADGFQAGFADYLYAGGTGEPPALPPRHYWKVGYESAAGHQAMEDWFAGFRAGANVARDSGYRRWTVLPTSANCPAAETVTVPPALLPAPVSPPVLQEPLPSPQPMLTPPPEVLAPKEPSQPTGHIVGVRVAEHPAEQPIPDVEGLTVCTPTEPTSKKTPDAPSKAAVIIPASSTYLPDED